MPTLILDVGDYAVVANHNGESYTSKFSVTSGDAKQIEVVMESAISAFVRCQERQGCWLAL